MPDNAAGATAAQSAPEHDLRAPLDLSETARVLRDSINASAVDAQLVDLNRQAIAAAGDGRITWEEQDYLARCIERKRPPRGAAANRTAVGGIVGRDVRGFTARRYQRTPNRDASRERRRELGGSGALPHEMRGCYTEGQRAILCIIAVKSKGGICDLPIDHIAALAGVCRTTVQSTVLAARRHGHLVCTERPRRGQRSLTNLFRIVSPTWLTWINRGAAALRRIGSNLESKAHPTENQGTLSGDVSVTEGQQGAWKASLRRGRSQNEKAVPRGSTENSKKCR